ncbi:unnamed protein product [Onchocerca flexuosa]|uniref:ANK_REP_REGION domain-containing protein n=1 Tax=Onchocerca flexuosa TaxID=387005 RepID=A0A183I876_9BILA|nr:unnamed protein product [Onchocerca flexuosa]
MEACDRGATAIVDLLLKFGANVAIKNCDNWTALDFFRNAIKMGMVEDDVMEEAKQLVSIMEMKLKEGFVIYFHIYITSKPIHILESFIFNILTSNISEIYHF